MSAAVGPLDRIVMAPPETTEKHNVQLVRKQGRIDQDAQQGANV